MIKRKRLTITLKEDIIQAIDRIIDRDRIRNRSHAIGYLLSQTLEGKVKKAFILAGGRGIKMRPFTKEIPKSMLLVKGRPILEYQIEALRESDVRDILIMVGYLGEKIKYYFGDGSKFGVKIDYLEQPRGEIGSAFALKLAENFLRDERRFLVLYGDVLAKIDLKDFIYFHTSQKKIGTLALTSIKESSLYGVVKLKGSKIVDFIEKPKKEEFSRVVNSGIFIFENEIFNYLNKTKKENLLEKAIFPTLIKEGQLLGYLFEGKWFDIGTPEIYARTLKEWE